MILPSPEPVKDWIEARGISMSEGKGVRFMRNHYSDHGELVSMRRSFSGVRLYTVKSFSEGDTVEIDGEQITDVFVERG